MEVNRSSGINGAAADAVAGKRANLLSADALDNDLPRFCLELDPAESKRALAWVNSICLVYVIIGIVGLKAPAIDINKRPISQEEATPVVIEPLITAVQQISPDSNPDEAIVEKPPEEGVGVAVVLDSPAVAFSVPTVGNVLVPMSMAQAPPAHPMQGVVPINSPHIEQINVTGVGGSRPAPSYPRESLLNREQGTVVLLIEVEESGRASSVKVKESSGYVGLDKAASDHVRRIWHFGSANGKRLYECAIVFQLQ